MSLRLPSRADRITKHLSILVFITGFLALAYELSTDHRASGPPPLSASVSER
jgi:hypothetical protein